MTVPAVAFGRFLTGLLMGCFLGIFYGFLRPLRWKKPVLGDLLFAIAMGWAYLHYSFAVCRGDLRIGYFAAPIAGAILWDRSIGQWLQPVFTGFWALLDKTSRPFRIFLKKFCNFLKFSLATGKKWVTIKWRKHLHKLHISKGVQHESKEKSLQPYPADLPPQLHAD